MISGTVGAIDLGATKVTGALVDSDCAIGRRITEPPDTRTVSRLIRQLLRIASTLISEASRESVACVAVGSPGIVDYETGKIMFSAKLPFRGFGLREYLERRLPITVVVENDAKAQAIGESRYGLGKNCESFIYLAVGSGIGGAYLLRGELVRGATNSAGEFGHVPVSSTGERCYCGNTGCLSVFASGRAIAKRYCQISGIGAGIRMAASEVFSRAHEGDQSAKSVIEVGSRALSAAIASLIYCLNPHRIVLGGGLILNQPDFVMTTLRHLREIVLPQIWRRTSVKVSRLGSDAALLGLSSLCWRSGDGCVRGSGDRYSGQRRKAT
jgi:glucokinase